MLNELTDKVNTYLLTQPDRFTPDLSMLGDACLPSRYDESVQAELLNLYQFIKEILPEVLEKKSKKVNNVYQGTYIQGDIFYLIEHFMPSCFEALKPFCPEAAEEKKINTP